MLNSRPDSVRISIHLRSLPPFPELLPRTGAKSRSPFFPPLTQERPPLPEASFFPQFRKYFFTIYTDDPTIPGHQGRRRDEIRRDVDFDSLTIHPYIYHKYLTLFVTIFRYFCFLNKSSPSHPLFHHSAIPCSEIFPSHCGSATRSPSQGRSSRGRPVRVTPKVISAHLPDSASPAPAEKTRGRSFAERSAQLVKIRHTFPLLTGPEIRHG